MKSKNIIIISILLMTIIGLSYIGINKYKESPSPSLVQTNTEEEKENEIKPNQVAIMVEQTAGQEDYVNQDTIPSSGYTLNSTESYCEVNGTKDSSINLSYDNNTGALTIAPMSTSGTKCYLYFNIAFTITVASNNTSYGTVSNLSSSTIAKGGSVTVTVTPTSGYYLSAGSCNPSSGYKISNMSTGTSATGSQTVRITNSSVTSGNKYCYFYFAKCTYTETAVAAAFDNNDCEGTYTATYVCNGKSSKNCKIAQCEYTGTGSNSIGKYAVCNGGYFNNAPTDMCTYGSSYSNGLSDRCNTSLPGESVYYGSFASSSTHACS